MKEMVGGCCVCSDDRGWAENPLVYCDGAGCTVAVHQACYGIVTVPVGNWYCRKCEAQDSKSKVRCELCPNKEGALKPTDNNAWAHVVCALYIPEVRFGNVTTMEPIILSQIPQERFHKTCYICEERSRSRANFGACMQCNKAGCRMQFHVTCAQGLGLLCEEASNYMENVKYCGYCHHHYNKIKKGGNVKVIPPYRPVGGSDSPEESPSKDAEPTKTASKRKISTTGTSKLAKATNANAAPEAEPPAPENETKPSTTDPEPPLRDKVNNKRRKGGSRTPPVDGGGGGGPAESGSRPDSPSARGVQQGLGPPPSSTAAPTPPASSASVVSSPHVPTSKEAVPVPPSSTSSTTSSSSTSSITATATSSSTTTPVTAAVTLPAVQQTASSRPNSIVVTVPLEALPLSTVQQQQQQATGGQLAGGAAGATGGGGQQPAATTGGLSAGGGLSTAETPPPPPHLPAKRQRSQSSEKPEKSRRWLKRSSTGKPGSPPPSLASPAQSGSKSQSPGETSGQQQPVAEVRPRRTGSANPPPPPLPPPPPPPAASSPAAVSSQAPASSSSVPSSSSTVTVKEEKDVKIFQNGLHAPHMLGNQLNPSSTMAQKMCDTLSQEMVAHSVFTQQDSTQGSALIGPQLHRTTSNRVGPWLSGSGTTTTNNHYSNSTSNHVPSSLEHLLERQWEQGSQFLMEQAQHFDIASLLSCLHQLRSENAQLEEHVTSLVQRRDHLLAVNARLAIPLVTPQPTVNNVMSNPPGVSNNNNNNSSSSSGVGAAPVLENGLATPSEQQLSYQRTSAPQPPLPRSSSAGFSSGGGGHLQQNSVVVRASSGDRRSSSTGSTYSNPSHHGNNPHSGGPLPGGLSNSHGNPHGNPHGNSTSVFSSQGQPSPVVIRRELMSELGAVTGHGGGGVNPGSGNPGQPKPPQS